MREKRTFDVATLGVMQVVCALVLSGNLGRESRQRRRPQYPALRRFNHE